MLKIIFVLHPPSFATPDHIRVAPEAEIYQQMPALSKGLRQSAVDVVYGAMRKSAVTIKHTAWSDNFVPGQVSRAARDAHVVMLLPSPKTQLRRTGSR